MSPRNPLVVLVLAAFIGVGPAAGVVAGEPAGEPHLPDLLTLPPTHLRVQVTGGTKRLRLTNTVANLGTGPLEVRPRNDAGPVPRSRSSGSTRTARRGRGAWPRRSRSGPSCSAHNHWHLAGFARYDLLNRNGKVVRSSRKVSFCLVDSVFVAAPPPHDAPWAYNQACSKNAVQGISVGWGDTYSWNLAGQSINITGLANGTYRLRSTADPFNRIRETDDGNNASTIRFRLRGRRIVLLD